MQKLLDIDQVNKLIDIVDGHYDYRTLVINLAKTNPMALLEAVGFGKSAPHFIVSRYFRDNPKCNKIEAIKYIRCEVQLGLKEAKDLVEDVALEEGFIFSSTF